MIKKILTLIVFFQVFVSFSQELEKKEKIPLQEPISSQIIKESSSADKRADTPFRQRLVTGGINVKGNMTFIGNSILNRDTDKTAPIRTLYKFNGTGYYVFNGADTANDPYNSDLFWNNGGRAANVNNGNVYMDYIDVDGDVSTFSSSKATLTLPTCSRIVYAGLYWAGVYPYETWQNEEPRSIDKNKIKFKIPGGNYIDLIANTTDSSIREQIYDDGAFNQKPYVYYKDVTNLIDKDNPNGDYFAANIRGIRGIRSTGGGIGGAAGWALILIYENEAESSKNISLFDGFATIDGTNDVDVSYTGFTTIPAGPVRAELIVATLEGDGFIEEDQFQIEDNNGNFIDVSNSKNPANNFFNGSITKYGNYAAGRNPSSENTLGFDVDLLTLNNPSNSVIGNVDTSANVRFTTSGDVYWSFLTAMSVEIIEPKIQLVKTIDDGAGNDVVGTPVGLGSELWYEVSFQNIGTDNALNTEIVDRLPKNVDLIEADLVLPDPRITYTYEAPTPANGFRGELRLKIPDDMVEEGGIKHSFRFKVKVVTDCNELRDVCSNKIENQAYANYDSDEGNTPRITNDLSFSGVDACNLGVIGTSNFLIDTSGCTFERDEILCGSSITLTAGAGFQSYEWKDPNGNVIGTNQTVTVSVPGTYTVSKIAPVGCIDTTEKINVIPYNNEPNPLLPFIDRMLTCPNDLSGLSNVAEIYLCGTGSSRAINLPFTGTTATTVEWFKLDETSCPDAVTGCANVNTACTWQSIGTSFSETIANEGEYRVDVLYDGRCPTSYYFNVFKATLNPDIVKKDIICGKQGSITVNNVPNGYEYKLTGPNGYSVGFQNGNSFTVSDIGDYNLEIRIQNSSAASCIYTYPSINIQNKNIDINLGQSTVLCATDPVDLRVQVSNAPGEYTYVLTEDGNTTPIATFGPTTDNDYTFQVTNAGDYTVQVSTPDCTGTESITINKPLPLTLTAANTKEITCKDGTSDGLITLISGGGTITVGDTYKYAVWTDKGTDLYASISDIPSTAYFTNNVYNVVNGQEGIYRFIVVDSNNCYKVSNPIEIKVEPELTFTAKPKDVTCSGQADGQIEVSLNGGALGYLIEYKEENATTWNTSGVFTGLPANTYTIDVRASKNGYQCLYKIEGIEIKVPNPIVSSASKTKEYTCLENGEITFEEATGGTAPYSYGIQDGATGIMQYTPNRVKGGLTEGIYKLAVKDANNCTLTLADIVIDPLPIKPTFSTNVAYNCDGTGSVTITPAGAGYSYLLDGVAQADPMSNVFTNVAVGLHTIRVDYGSSCTVDISVRVLADKEFSAKVIATTNSICNNSDNGTITVLAEDFVGGDFEYSIDGGATWSMAGDNPYKIVGLQDGVYNVFVKEGACEIDLGNITIEEPPKLVLSASIEEGASCSGTDTGATIKATAVGGTPPYTYSIDGGATWNTTGVFTNVPPSATEYEINVRDSRNCNECGCSIDPFINGGFEDPASSTSRPDIRFISEDNFPGWDTTASDNIIEVWSNGYNGVFASEGSSFVELNANRVSTLYQEYCTQPGDIISWSLDHRGRAGVDVADVRIGGSLTTATIVETMSDDKNAWGSYSGTYTVPAGQSVTLVSFEAVSTASGNNTIGNFIDNVNIQINKVSCVPIKIKVDPPATIIHDAKITECYDGSNGQIEVNVTQGGGNYQFRIDGGVWLAPTPSTATTYTFTGLTPKTYTVEVLDGLGCISAPSTHVLHPVLKASSVLTNVTCDPGEIAITGEGGDGNYVYAVVPVGDPTSGFVAGNTFPIAVAGNYDVYVRDNNGNAKYCEYKETVTIGAITSPKASLTAVQPNCTGNTGTINVFISEGAGPYEVTLTGVATGVTSTVGPSAATTASFTGLSSDTYEIEVKDANGCKSTKVSEVIAVPDPIVSSASKTKEYTCLENGEITFVQATGGTAPYSYGIQDGATGIMQYSSSRTKGGLTEGVYKLAVKDANNCILTLADITIDPLPVEPTFSTGIVYNCDGTGTITVTPTGAGYSYLLDGVAQADPASNVFANVAVGLHTIRVDYGSSCTIDVSATVLANQEFTAKVDSNTDNRCNGSDDGTITLIASNYGTSYEYSIDGGGTWATATTSPFVIDPVAEGTHAVQVRTTLGTTCVLPLGDVTISEPAPVVTSATIEQIADCRGTGATIQAVSTGGTPPYEYSIDGGATWNITGEFSNVVASVTPYTIQSKDSKGCVSVTNATITVTAPPGVVHDAEITECYDGNNGQIVVNVTQGNGNYQFRIDGGAWLAPTPSTATTYTFTGLTPKTYTVEVLDGLGCISAPSTHVLHPVLKASSVLTNVTCDPGEIAITGEGGDGNYVYAVVPVGDPTSGFVAGNTFPIAVAGDYDVYVRDNNGNAKYCEYKETVTIGAITSPKASLTAVQPNCTGNTGTINVFISEGAGPYEVTLTGVATGVTSTVGPSAATTASFTGLSSDTYEIEVKDANGCKSTKVSEVIAVPDPIVSSASKTKEYTCLENGEITFVQATGGTAPYSYGIQDGATGIMQYSSSLTKGGLTEGVYKLAVRDANNCILTLADITIDPLPVEPTFSTGIVYNCDGTGTITVTPTGAGYSYLLDGVAQADPASNVFANVAVGLHTIRVDYGSSCTIDVSATVLANQEFTAKVDSNTDNRCNGSDDGTITLIASNYGTSYEYSIDGGGTWATATTSPFVIDPVAEGTHAVQVRTTLGTTCVLPLGDVTISEPAPVVTSATIEQIADCRGTGATIQAVSTGGTPPYEYSIDGGATWNITGKFSNVVASVTPYTIQSKDSKGCVSVTNATITVTAPPGVVHDAEITECYDGNNGQIVVNVTQGNGNYQFRIDGGPWQTPTPSTATTYTFTGLGPKTYTVEVLDGLGCKSLPSTHSLDTEIAVSATKKELSCNPGEITVSGLGGDGNYVYTVVPVGDPATGFSTTTVYPISVVGDYDVYVRDNNGSVGYCEDVTTLTITQITNPKVSLSDNSPRCFGETGTVTVAIQNGLSPYKIEVVGALGYTNTVTSFTGTNKTYSGLVADAYTVTITDANGCIVTDTINLIQFPELNPTTLGVVPPGVCVNYELDNSGFGFDFTNLPTVSAPYSIEYSKDNGTSWQVSPIFRSMNPGTEINPAIRIIDGTGTQVCINYLDRFETPFNVKGLIVNPVSGGGSCLSGFNVTVEAIGGVGPFEFAINAPTGWFAPDAAGPGDPDRTKTFSGLVPGRTYEFFVRDTSTGCIEQNTEDIYAIYTPSVGIEGVVDNMSCSGANSGKITFTLDNTSGDLSDPFDYTLYKRDPSNTGIAVPAYTGINQSGFAPIVVAGLSPGEYYLELTGATGCLWASKDILIEEGTPIQGSVVKANDITCSTAGVVNIENVIGGFGGYDYTLTVTNATGITSPTGGATSIPISYVNVTDPTQPVNVAVEVVDSNGCSQNIGNVDLVVSQLPVIDAIAVSTCDVNKTITVTGTNGLAPYLYSIDNGVTYKRIGLFENLVVGTTYTIKIKDANGCESTTQTRTIHPSLDFNATVVKNLDCTLTPNATIQLDVLSGTNNYSYIVETSAGANVIPVTTFTTAVTTFSISAVGDYKVTLTDVTSGCSKVKEFTVKDSIKPIFTYDKEDSVCNGSNSGIIRLTAQDNGIVPLRYTISPDPNGVGAITTNVFEKLPPATYVVTAEGSNGCTTTSGNIVIDELTAIDIPAGALKVTEFGCTTGNVTNSATISIDASLITGGSGTYKQVEFIDTKGTATTADDVSLQKGSSFSYTSTAESGGDYLITIYDDKGCSESIAASIAPFAKLLTTKVVVDKKIDCNTGEDITVNYTSSTPVLAPATVSYMVTGTKGNTATNTTGVFTGLVTDTYTVTVTNTGTNCVLTSSHQVLEEPKFVLDINKLSNVNCLGSNTGELSFEFSSSTPYVGNYDYEIFDQGGTLVRPKVLGVNGLVTVTGLSSGSYYVVATMVGSPFCPVKSATIEIEEPDAALNFTTSVKAVSCKDGANGIITVNPVGGWGSYQYELSDALGTTVIKAYNPTNIFKDLSPNTYTVRVKDINGCVVSKTETLVNPDEITFNLVKDDNVCTATSGGSITVTAVGGTGNYTYILVDGSGTEIRNQTTNVFASLGSGTYTVNVKDSNNCSAVSTQNITLHPNLEFTVTETKKIDCTVSPSGIVSVSILSGSGNYEYEVLNSLGGSVVARVAIVGTTVTFNTVAKDIYTINVYDVGATPNCSITKKIDIDDSIKPIFTYDKEDSVCNGSNSGIIRLTAQDNGIVPLRYTISPDPNGVGAITGDVFEKLPPATYVVTAEGSNGCTTTSGNIVIDELTAIDIPAGALKVTEFGCTTGNVTNSATISIDASLITGGSGTYKQVEFIDTKGTATTADDVVLQKGSSYSYTSTAESGGDYLITIYDDKGCSESIAASIAPFAKLLTTKVVVDKKIDCNTGEDITVTYTSSTPVLAPATVSYMVTGTKGYTATNTTGVFTGLVTDTYTVTVTNTGTNCVLTSSHQVLEEPKFVLDINKLSNVNCLGSNTGELSFEFSSSTPYVGNYDYEIFDQGGTLVRPKVLGVNGLVTVTGLSSGSYYVVATMVGSPFCPVQSATIEIEEPDAALNFTTSVKAVSCKDGANGIITVNPVGGWGSYQYELSDALGTTVIKAYNPTNIFKDLSPNTYTVRVKDINGCVVSKTETLVNPDEITFNLVKDDNVCTATSGGSITVTAVGGTGNYTYILVDGSGTEIRNQTTNVFASLGSGTYTVNVKDSNNCSAVSTQNITLHPNLEFTVTETKKIDCTVSPSGIVSVSILSGSGNYEYEVLNSLGGSVVSRVAIVGTTVTFNTVAKDIYTINVYDVGATPNCSITKKIDIDDSIKPIFTYDKEDSVCNGANSGIIRLTAQDNGIVPLRYTISPDPNGVGAITTNVFEKLPPATYVVTAEGSNGCTTTSGNIVIDELTAIDIPAGALKVTEFGCTTGNVTNSATISIDASLITGGSGTYKQVEFIDTKGTATTADDVSLQKGSSFSYTSTAESGGDYLITIYDDKGCSESIAASIAPFAKLLTTKVVVDKKIDCNTGEDITVNYTSSTPVLAPATVSYMVTGTKGNTATNTTGVFTGLVTDTYTVTVTNTGTNCVLTSSHQVLEEPKFVLDINKLSNVNCLGSNTGELSFEFSSSTPYVGNYDYEIFDQGGTLVRPKVLGVNGLVTVTGLSSGSYYVVATMVGSPFCPVQSATIEIEEPDAALKITTTPTLISCIASNTGEVVISAEGGWGGYQYQLLNTTTGVTHQNFATNGTIIGLNAGVYVASVRDANGCIVTDTFTLNAPDPIAETHSVITNVCDGESTATITIDTVSGGQGISPTYTYILVYPDGSQSASQSSNQFTGLPEGDYSVIITDDYSCTYTTPTIKVIDPDKVVASAGITGNITCRDPQATITVTGTGGTAPYMYSNDGINFVASNVFRVDAGQHKYYVRDSKMCVSEAFFVTVAALEELEAKLDTTSATVTCNGEANAVLSAIAKGAFGSYEYELLDAADPTNLVVVRPNQTSKVFRNLGPGTYKIRVTSGDCVTLTEAYEIKEPDALEVTGSKTDITCTGEKDGTITVNAVGGTGTYIYALSTDPRKFQKENMFSSLPAGTYTVTVKDERGCFNTIDFEIESPDPLIISPTALITQQVCIEDATPTFTIEVEGGRAPYFTSIDGGQTFNQGKLTYGAADGIVGGKTYLVYVKDSSGCTPAKPVTVVTTKPVDLNLSVNTVYECDGVTITATVNDEYKNQVVYLLQGNTTLTNDTGVFENVLAGQNYTVTVEHALTGCKNLSSPFEVEDIKPLGMTIDDSEKNILRANGVDGRPPYLYSIDGSNFDANNEFVITQTRDYTITVRDDRGCEFVLTVAGEYITIDVPNLFTPDGDGNNDYWYPNEVESYHDIEVFIYDRYARKITSFKGDHQGWDGTYQGRHLPSGDYWYAIYYKELSGQKKKLMGHFTLYR